MASLTSRATTDSFLAEHYNTLAQTLREVFGITDNGQAYIDIGSGRELRIGDVNTIIKVINSQLQFKDAVSGGFYSLSRFGGNALALPLYYGYPGFKIANGASVANTVYLTAIYVPVSGKVTKFVIDTATNNANVGLYDTSGNLLVDGGTITAAGPIEEATINYDIAAGTYYMAIQFNGNANKPRLAGPVFKSVAAGSFALPASVVVPGPWDNAGFPQLLVPQNMPIGAT